jgi:hypothetical protein
MRDQHTAVQALAARHFADAATGDEALARAISRPSSQAFCGRSRSSAVRCGIGAGPRRYDCDAEAMRSAGSMQCKVDNSRRELGEVASTSSANH